MKVIEAGKLRYYKTDVKRPEVKKEVRQKLQEYFLKDIDKTSALIGCSLDHWFESSGDNE